MRFNVEEVTQKGNWVMEEVGKAATLTPTLSRVRKRVEVVSEVAREREQDTGGV